MKVFVIDNEDDKFHLFLINLKGFTKHRLYIYVTALIPMNGITIWLIFLIVISMVLPATAIRYASGQSTDNSDDSTTTTPDNSGSSTGGGSTTTTTPDNSGSSTGGGSTTSDNSGSTTTGDGTTTTDNSATLSTTSTASNNTGNESADFIKTILDIHNRERAAVGVPPLVWSDKLAADAKPWAEHLTTLENTGQSNAHDLGQLGNLHEGESVAEYPHFMMLNKPLGQMAEAWVAEKKDYHAGEVLTEDNFQPIGHYTQMVWKTTTQVGCAAAYAAAKAGETTGKDILVCRYIPQGNYIGQAPY